MRKVFGDAGYWIALLFPRDSLHDEALELTRTLKGEHAVVATSEMVLIEVLDYFAEFGQDLRLKSVSFVRNLYRNGVVVRELDSALFQKALSLYEERPDKEWSLTDCASILIMQEIGITEALAHDRHFEQAGFQAMLR